jgi:glycosyltransferase involved in cell wall biosynthesis
VRGTLSIVIPAYNEDRFIGAVLRRIEAVDLSSLAISKEVIVVDDGSDDRTSDVVSTFPGVTLQRHPVNRGKGHAVRMGLAWASGDYVIIQDADLEYDPADYLPMLRALREGHADAVYGSRYLESGRRANQSWVAYVGGRSVSLALLAFTGSWLTDTVTAYKLFNRADLLQLHLQSDGFELDHEITARLLASGKRIVEIPIRYVPRTRAEGKKVGLHDWFMAIYTLFRYRHG